jgi:anti-sigma B factor antagonist
MGTVSMESGADGVLTVALSGEIDFTNAAPINVAVRDEINRRRPSAVQVDLAAVIFLDSSGIGVLVRAMRTAGDAGAGFRVVDPTDKVFDQLRGACLLDVFGLAEPEPDPPGRAG